MSGDVERKRFAATGIFGEQIAQMLRADFIVMTCEILPCGGCVRSLRGVVHNGSFALPDHIPARVSERSHYAALLRRRVARDAFVYRCVRRSDDRVFRIERIAITVRPSRSTRRVRAERVRFVDRAAAQATRLRAGTVTWASRSTGSRRRSARWNRRTAAAAAVVLHASAQDSVFWARRSRSSRGPSRRSCSPSD